MRKMTIVLLGIFLTVSLVATPSMAGSPSIKDLDSKQVYKELTSFVAAKKRKCSTDTVKKYMQLTRETSGAVKVENQSWCRVAYQVKVFKCLKETGCGQFTEYGYKLHWQKSGSLKKRSWIRYEGVTGPGSWTGDGYWYVVKVELRRASKR